jgi:Photoprotection regulator fluorescence recovery protein
MFRDLHWSPTEKKIARKAYDAALESALGKIVTEFKRRAAAAVTVTGVWEIEDYLREQRREIDQMFDFRYSQLPSVFAYLIRKGIWRKERLTVCRKRNVISFARFSPLQGRSS